MDDLFKDLTDGAGVHADQVVKHEAEIKADKVGQYAGGADAQNVDALGVGDSGYGLVEADLVSLIQGHADLFNIRLHDHGHHILVANAFLGHLHPLDGGELVADHFLQGFLHTGIAVKAQLSSKAHHGGLADIDCLTQLAGGHERSLIIGL